MDMHKDYTWEELRKLGAGDAGKTHYVSENLKYVDDKSACNIPVLRDNVIQYVSLMNITDAERVELCEAYAGLWLVRDKFKSTGYTEWLMEYNLAGQFFAFNAIFLGDKGGTKGTANAAVHESEHTYADAARTWGIPRNLDISSKAALFYLLYTRSLRKDKRATDELEYFIADLAPDVAAYLDMVAGGEARHMIRMKLKFEPGRGRAPEDVEKALEGGYVKINSEGIVYLADAAGRDLTSSQIGGHDRAFAWINWKALREEYKLNALDWCIMAHCTVQDGGYGGPLWANCANLVRKRELGEVKDLMFIDQAFSLQHNGGPIFNKLWNTQNIVTVLDNAFKGDVQKNEAYLTKEDRALYRKATYGLTAYDGVRHGSSYKPHDKTLDDFKQSQILKIKAQETLEAING